MYWVLYRAHYTIFTILRGGVGASPRSRSDSRLCIAWLYPSAGDLGSAGVFKMAVLTVSSSSSDFSWRVVNIPAVNSAKHKLVGAGRRHRGGVSIISSRSKDCECTWVA